MALAALHSRHRHARRKEFSERLSGTSNLLRSSFVKSEFVLIYQKDSLPRVPLTFILRIAADLHTGARGPDGAARETDADRVVSRRVAAGQVEENARRTRRRDVAAGGDRHRAVTARRVVALPDVDAVVRRRDRAGVVEGDRSVARGRADHEDAVETGGKDRAGAVDLDGASRPPRETKTPAPRLPVPDVSILAPDPMSTSMGPVPEWLSDMPRWVGVDATAGHVDAEGLGIGHGLDARREAGGADARDGVVAGRFADGAAAHVEGDVAAGISEIAGVWSMVDVDAHAVARLDRAPLISTVTGFTTSLRSSRAEMTVSPLIVPPSRISLFPRSSATQILRAIAW